MPVQIAAGLATGMGMANGAQGLIPPLQTLLSGMFNDLFPNARPDIAMCLTLRHRLQMDETTYYDIMQQNGFPKDWAKAIWEGSYNFFSLGDYCQMYRRTDISRPQFDNLMEQIGVNSWHREQVLRLTEYWPTAPDIVQFAVREVYHPEKRKELKLDDERPAEYMEMAAKIGLSEDFAKDYWASHWQLPSVTAVFEMLHRRAIKPDGNVFTKADVAKFLSTADYSPQWRDMMTQISYTPLTRVDTRRMYGLGILTRNDVVDNFLDQGYTPENAERMTEFTTVHDNPETTDLTRANVTQSYVHGIIDLDELVSMIGELGYQPKMLNYWVTQAQYQKVKYQVDLRAGLLLDMFLSGGQTLDEYRNSLYQMELPMTFVNQLVDEAIVRKMSVRKTPDISTLKAWLIQGVISQDQFYNKLILLGYSVVDAQNYLTEIALKVDVSRRKYLKIDVYKSWRKLNIYTDKQLIDNLTEQGYGQEDINNILIEIRSGENES